MPVVDALADGHREAAALGQNHAHRTHVHRAVGEGHVGIRQPAGLRVDHQVRANPAATDGANSDLILSGGLTVDNVAAGIRAVLPAWVDVSSGVQGIDARQKDLERMTRFISAVRQWNSGIA